MLIYLPGVWGPPAFMSQYAQRFLVNGAGTTPDSFGQLGLA
jgi:hypothetical protein